MGAAGAGKTTVAAAIALRLGRDFIDADLHHSLDSRRRMAAGESLDDDTRRLWLDAVGAAVNDVIKGGREVVVACSALRREHRDRLRERINNASFVWLDVPEAELRRRLDAREGHFAGPEILESQLEALESPDSNEATRIDASAAVDEVVSMVLAGL